MPLLAAETTSSPLRARIAPPWLAPSMRVVLALAEVCRELRLEICKRQGLKDTDFQPITGGMMHGAGRNARTLKNFEEGKSNPTHLDDVVLGYAQAAGMPASEIWLEAIRRAEKALKTAPADRPFGDTVQAARQVRDGPATKRRAKGKRKAT